MRILLRLLLPLSREHIRQTRGSGSGIWTTKHVLLLLFETVLITLGLLLLMLLMR
jgi:hypothetical protein